MSRPFTKHPPRMIYYSVFSSACSWDQELENIHVYMISKTRTKMWTALWVSVFMHSFEYIKFDIKKPCLYRKCIKEPICQTLKQIRCLHQYRGAICINILTHVIGSSHIYNCVRGWEQALTIGYQWFSSMCHFLYATQNIHDRNVSTD